MDKIQISNTQKVYVWGYVTGGVSSINVVEFFKRKRETLMMWEGFGFVGDYPKESDIKMDEIYKYIYFSDRK